MSLLPHHIILLISFVALIIHISGVVAAAHAVMNSRTSQGTIAWVVSLLILPYVSLWFYLVLGRNKFNGYAEAHRQAYLEFKDSINQIYYELDQYSVEAIKPLISVQSISRDIHGIAFQKGNAARLLINGEETYAEMKARMRHATSYICLQSYIWRDDEICNEFKEILIERASQGVKIYFLYDEIGCYHLTEHFIKDLLDHHIEVSAFHTTKGKGNRFQINFRNHRKLVLIDGAYGFVGGLNFGDEYLGKNPKFGNWRDTHLLMMGPSVQCMQISFAQDWYWATHDFPTLNWQIRPAEENISALIFPTGPADQIDAATLMMMSIINKAKKRLWIASPYFVPDKNIIHVLQLAALRGVDVRILLPAKADHLMVYLCSFAYYDELKNFDIKLYRYRDGFMHQKIFVVDDEFAGVGTVNLDNRSLNINFEITAIIADPDFVQQTARMLQEDFVVSHCVNVNEYESKSFISRIIIRLARLMAPIL